MMNIKKKRFLSVQKHLAIGFLLLLSWQQTVYAFYTDMASVWYKKYILANPVRRFIPGYPLILDSICIPGYGVARMRCFSQYPLHAVATVAFYEAKDVALIKGALDQKRGASFLRGTLTVAALSGAAAPGTLFLESFVSKKPPVLVQQIIQKRTLAKTLMLQTVSYGLGRLSFAAYDGIKKLLEQK